MGYSAAYGGDEDVDALWVDPATGYLYLSAASDFAAGVGLGGDANDLFVCAPLTLGDSTSCSLGLFWDAGSHGLAGGNVRGLGVTQSVGQAAVEEEEATPGSAVRLHLPFVASPGGQ